jgi:hypothetical protein
MYWRLGDDFKCQDAPLFGWVVGMHVSMEHTKGCHLEPHEEQGHHTHSLQYKTKDELCAEMLNVEKQNKANSEEPVESTT